MMYAAETEARRRGCRQMIVSALSFQAPGFYRSLGYVETGRTEGHPVAAGAGVDVDMLDEVTRSRDGVVLKVIELPVDPVAGRCERCRLLLDE